jgi:4-hydroxythreonine-4-phosphate dehydrogenase
MTLPPVALSCGEPAGIGPEIAAAAWAALRDELVFFWIGDPRHLPEGTPVVRIGHPSEATDAMALGMPVLAQEFAGNTARGTPDPANAAGVIAAVETGVSLVRDGAASALCTAPIHKKALIDGAGFAYPGHTEFLAALAGVDQVVMMLAAEAVSPPLRVVPATIHIALRDVPAKLTTDSLRRSIEITEHGLRDSFGIPHPRIAVSGLNPHAGEGGAMGTEDAELIAPVVAALRETGMQITGPLPADTMFHAAARARYDAAVAMYHDQALIPIKTLDFDGGVNVTLGLPFVRTSPDHGTACDIAGQGIARPDSLIAALRLALRMAHARHTT